MYDIESDDTASNEPSVLRLACSAAIATPVGSTEQPSGGLWYHRYPALGKASAHYETRNPMRSRRQQDLGIVAALQSFGAKGDVVDLSRSMLRSRRTIWTPLRVSQDNDPRAFEVQLLFLTHGNRKLCDLSIRDLDINMIENGRWKELILEKTGKGWRKSFRKRLSTPLWMIHNGNGLGGVLERVGDGRVDMPRDTRGHGREDTPILELALFDDLSATADDDFSGRIDLAEFMQRNSLLGDVAALLGRSIRERQGFATWFLLQHCSPEDRATAAKNQDDAEREFVATMEATRDKFKNAGP
ncbi:hypothetical protein B0H63DRAFT_450531 [Podospora didyma]|uniref:Uncharacterized protein n=1 Tax=Podospora didyma TaxID=330526 RepID=A0AAE0NGT9_9PEZI|nr:hypothetical protein B0H63DRAFT_450531 [Podospora didyma]